MQAYQPQQILMESQVRKSTLAQKVLDHFPNTPLTEIENIHTFKIPGPMTPAKKVLALAAYRGRALKPFPKISGSINLNDFVFNPISNCHLECTYCILQSYLANNPILTLYTNLSDLLAEIRGALAEEPRKIHRLGTGELSDSLALDDLTENSLELVPFFSRCSNAYLELKTKSDRVGNLLQITHGGRTVVSWSMSPERVVEKEEHKCATLQERVAAARRVQEVGYPVGIHLDPMIYFEGWEQAYDHLIETLTQALDPQGLAWVSMGTLRFDKDLKGHAEGRFPGTRIFTEEFVEGPDGKMRYFKTLRLKMLRRIWRQLNRVWPQVPRYLCMEAPWVWEAVTSSPAPQAQEVEARLIGRLEALRQSN